MRRLQPTGGQTLYSCSELFKHYHTYKLPIALVKVQILIQQMGWELRVGISNKLPGDPDTIVQHHAFKSEAPITLSGSILPHTSW